MDAIKDKLTGFLDGGNADADPVKMNGSWKGTTRW